MNQRDDVSGREHAQRGRDFPAGTGSQGFESTNDRAYEGQAGRGRSADQIQSPQGQYERDPYAQDLPRFAGDERNQERWYGGVERPPHRPRQGAGRWAQQNEYGYGQDYDQRYASRGSGHERAESDRYRPVTEEWEAARGYGDLGRYDEGPRGESRYGEGGWGGGRSVESPHGARRPGGYGAGSWAERGYGESRSGGYGETRLGEGRYSDEGRYRDSSVGQDLHGEGRWSQGRYGRHARIGWESGGSPQPYYGTRTYWNDRPSWQDQYGFGQGRWPDPSQYRSERYRSESENRARYQEGGSPRYFSRNPYGRGEHSSEQLFEREPFGRAENVRYYGTGAPGWGGSGFTGGAYAYGYGSRYPTRSPESEYSDESAVSYGGSYGRGYGRTGGYGTMSGHGERQYARGPKGYQRSDERLKEDISERLMEACDIDSSEVTVDVKGAKVILEGIVPSRHMKHAIEDMVDACPGVQDIDNRIRVSSPNYQGSAITGGGTSGWQSGRAPQSGTQSASGVSQPGLQASTSSSSQSGVPLGVSGDATSVSASNPGGNAGSQTNSAIGSRTKQ